MDSNLGGPMWEAKPMDNPLSEKPTFNHVLLRSVAKLRVHSRSLYNFKRNEKPHFWRLVWTWRWWVWCRHQRCLRFGDAQWDSGRCRLRRVCYCDFSIHFRFARLIGNIPICDGTKVGSHSHRWIMIDHLWLWGCYFLLAVRQPLQRSSHRRAVIEWVEWLCLREWERCMFFRQHPLIWNSDERVRLIQCQA